MKQNRIDASQLELTEKVVSIKRVTKVVKGGRRAFGQTVGQRRESIERLA